jgi:SAM-dependent methyltransferase
MDFEQMRQAIDYYLSETPSSQWQKVGIAFTAVAALAAAITAWVMHRTTRRTIAEMQRQTQDNKEAADATIAVMSKQIEETARLAANDKRDTNERYLAARWDEVFKECIRNPNFLDASKTDTFHRSMAIEEQLRYSAFCYGLWDLVNEMIRNGFASDVRSRALLGWARELHGTWLERNPDFFPDNTFWNAVRDAESGAHMIVRYKPLPHRDGAIDWEAIAPRYHDFILSPFAPAMLTADGASPPRNPLVTHLREKAEEARLRHAEGRRTSPLLRVIELGCGPGTLVDAMVAAEVTKLDCLVLADQSEVMRNAALAKAQRVITAERGIHALIADMRNVNTAGLGLADRIGTDGFDLVIAANSILFPDRRDVVRTFKACRDLLGSSGDALFILPSFDTTEYLERLWFASAWKKSGNNVHHALRVVRAFRDNKLLERERLLFADDGQHQQGYHAPRIFTAELKAAGFRLIEPEQVFYEWDLCKPFDYGHFPEAEALLASLPEGLVGQLEAEGLLERPRHWDGTPQKEIWDWFVRAR